MRFTMLWTAALLVACDGGKDPDTDDTDTDAGEDLCEAIDPSTTAVTESQGAGDYPSPTGGAIADGTYDLVAFEIYAPASPDGNVRARRLVVDGDTIVMINVDNGVADAIRGGTFSTSGAELSVSFSCPESFAHTLGYTATATELWLFDDSEPNVQKYQLQ